MPIAPVLPIPAIAYAVLGAIAWALVWVAIVLRDAGNDGIGFIEDVRWGAHDVVERVIGWIRILGDWAGNIVDWAHEQIDRLFEWPLRAIEIVRNWASELEGWSARFFDARDALADVLARIRDWIAVAHTVLTEGLPQWVTGQIASVTAYIESRIGQVERWVDGTIVSVRDWVQSLIAGATAWVEGRLAQVEAWVWDLVGWALAEARAFADAAAAAARGWAQAYTDALRSDVFAWIQQWTAFLEWLRSIAGTLADFLRDPWRWLFDRAGTALWILLAGWLAWLWDQVDP
ncbi:MAG: hypothetical protein QN122_13540 [Armatimonadota bacterium]|nr:hypothetical protein [Armatimonadota bacterium]